MLSSTIRTVVTRTTGASRSFFSTSTLHGEHLVYTVDLLRKKATGYLAENDTAQASEKSFQATKLALMSYITRLEQTSGVEIVPKHLENPWDYRRFQKLIRLIVKTAREDHADKIMAGWEAAYKFHVKGWTQNDLTVEEVTFSIPYVFRFIDIIEEELEISREMAIHVKDNLFTVNVDEIAAKIFEESKKGKIAQLLQHLNMRKELLQQLNAVYKKTHGEDLSDVLVKNKDAIDQFLGIKAVSK